MLPGAARGSQKQPEAARSGQKQPGAVRGSQRQPEAAKSSQKQPEAARSSQEQLGAARSSQSSRTNTDRNKHCEMIEPFANRRSKVDPRPFADTCLASSQKLQGEAKPKPFTETCSVCSLRLQAHSERQSEQQGVNKNTASPSSYLLILA